MGQTSATKTATLERFGDVTIHATAWYYPATGPSYSSGGEPEDSGCEVTKVTFEGRDITDELTPEEFEECEKEVEFDSGMFEENDDYPEPDYDD